MSTTWGEFMDRQDSAYTLSVESGSAGVKIVLEQVREGENFYTKFYMKDEDVEDLIQALEIAHYQNQQKGPADGIS